VPLELLIWLKYASNRWSAGTTLSTPVAGSGQGPREGQGQVKEGKGERTGERDEGKKGRAREEKWTFDPQS